MNYGVRLRSRYDTGYLHGHVTGEFHSPKDSVALQGATLRISSEHKCRLFLYDLTKTKVITGVAQAFETANPQDELAEGLRNLKSAVLYSRLTAHELLF
ncbi:MAG: hypothetical protein DWQ09_03495 [Proteobacteria bacterium]|nr:MAG: hypothetical protein DWQ09_03495 [Pseudomonadota bacterium]